jgi:hypothetical protein
MNIFYLWDLPNALTMRYFAATHNSLDCITGLHFLHKTKRSRRP